jgi:5-methylcytosine-specific restriction enzyme A
MRTAKLKDWVGKTPEAMPGQTVLLRLYAKQNGLCACGCGRVMNLNRDAVDCDHKVALIDGGENVESNLQLMLQEHHRLKTATEATARSEERRHKAKAFTALRKPRFASRGFPTFPKQHTATRPLRWKQEIMP